MKSKLLFVVNVDWFLVSHRLPILQAARAHGFEVHVACRFSGLEKSLEAEGFNLHPISFDRSGTNIFNELKAMYEIARLFKKLQPDCIHLVTIKPVLYGALLAKFFSGKSSIVAAVSGLGYIFISTGIAASIKQKIVSAMYRLGLNRSRVSVIFQNKTDLSFFLDTKIISEHQAHLILGSGVNLKDYSYFPTDNNIPIFAFLARLLKDKGLLEFVEAVKQLRSRNKEFRAVLIGSTDENPQSVSENTIGKWVNDGVVENWGFSSDVPNTLKNVDVVVLPSYREGLPKSLIEAAASGTAVLTTDVPGCRDAIKPDYTGYLVPVKDVDSLAERMEYLINNPMKRNELGINGRKWAEEAFDIKDVISKHLELYEKGRRS